MDHHVSLSQLSSHCEEVAINDYEGDITHSAVSEHQKKYHDSEANEHKEQLENRIFLSSPPCTVGIVDNQVWVATVNGMVQKRSIESAKLISKMRLVDGSTTQRHQLPLITCIAQSNTEVALQNLTYRERVLLIGKSGLSDLVWIALCDGSLNAWNKQGTQLIIRATKSTCNSQSSLT